MTLRCWQVETDREWTPGKRDRYYVAAVSEDEALRLGAKKAGQAVVSARVAFPWLDVSARVAGEPLPELQDGATRKSDGTVGASHPRTREVMDWLKSYAGRNTFVLDVKFKVENGRIATGRNVGQRKAYRVTGAQVEALAKVKDREAEAAKVRAQAGTGLNVWGSVPYGTLRAAAENERGTLSFVRIDKVESGKWADWVFVKAIVGDSEDLRLGSQRPDSGEYVGQWPTVLANVCRDVMAAVERYGAEVGDCGVCGRRLTNEESRAGGIGPVCRDRLRRQANA